MVVNHETGEHYSLVPPNLPIRQGDLIATVLEM
jgi:hypothetical protein